MKLKNLSKEELETMGYDDIAYLILEDNGAKLKLPEIFKEICDLLELSEEDYTNKIGDFFQLLSTDHRFIMLEKGFWDLKNRHQTKVIIEADEDQDVEEPDQNTEDDTDITEPDYDTDNYNNYDEHDTDDEETDDTDDDI